MPKLLTPAIRYATLEDAKAIAQVNIRSWQKMYREFIPESILKNLSLEERSQKWYELINGGVKVLVLEVESKIIGFTSLCPFRNSNTEELTGEISSLYLDPAYWRQGYGSKLCNEAIAELQADGYKKIVHWILEGNHQIGTFYESLNFKPTQITKLTEFYEGSALLTEVLYVLDL